MLTNLGKYLGPSLDWCKVLLMVVKVFQRSAQSDLQHLPSQRTHVFGFRAFFPPSSSVSYP